MNTNDLALETPPAQEAIRERMPNTIRAVAALVAVIGGQFGTMMSQLIKKTVPELPSRTTQNFEYRVLVLAEADSLTVPVDKSEGHKSKAAEARESTSLVAEGQVRTSDFRGGTQTPLRGGVEAPGCETSEAQQDSDVSRPTGVARFPDVSHAGFKALPSQPLESVASVFCRLVEEDQPWKEPTPIPQ